MTEHNIGDTLTLNGITYEVKAPDKCASCAFKDVDCSELADLIGECDGTRRRCKDDIVFVERKDDDRPMYLPEFKKMISEVMYRFAESNATDVGLKCIVNMSPSMRGAELNIYNFKVLTGNGIKEDDL